MLEAIIYIALLSFLIIGGVVAAFSLVEATNRTDAQVARWEEAHFLLRKLEWALGSIDTINQPATPGTNSAQLEIKKTTGEIWQFKLVGSQIEFSQDGGLTFIALNSENVSVSSVVFDHLGLSAGNPGEGVHVTFTINGQQYELTEYVRK